MPIAVTANTRSASRNQQTNPRAAFGRAAAAEPSQPPDSAHSLASAKDKVKAKANDKDNPNATATDSKHAQPPAPDPNGSDQNANQHTPPRQRVAVKQLQLGKASVAPKWGDADSAPAAAAAPAKPAVAAADRKGDAKADAKTGGKGKPQVPDADGAAGAKAAGGKASPATDSAASGDAADSADERLKSFGEIKTFDDLKLHDQLLRGIFSYGFETPSLIQQRAILPVAKGYDTIAQAQSGTGKTATFTIGALQRLSATLDLKQSQILVLSPTRELALQTYRVVKALGDYLSPTVHLCVGGTHTATDRAALSGANAAQVVIGTPGRVLHLIGSKALRTKNLTLLVIDEADEMLSAGFQEQMYGIFELLPPAIQIALFSATLPDECVSLANKFMRNPVRITVKREDVTLDGIKQFYVDVNGDANKTAARGGGRWAQQTEDSAKLAVLCDLYEQISVSQCIVYCNSRRRVEWLAQALNDQDFTVSSMHADMEPAERAETMQRFRTGASRVLIATDLLARGIDVHGVSLVVNFDLPKVRENYIHRIGRSGRFGRKGVAINFLAHRDDVAVLRELETFYATAINELPANVVDLM